MTAALIPPIAEATCRAGGYVKALLWWAVLVPAGAIVFFFAAAWVHDAKAGAEAERSAYRNADARAFATLNVAVAKLAMARAAANKAKGQKQCEAGVAAGWRPFPLSFTELSASMVSIAM